MLPSDAQPSSAHKSRLVINTSILCELLVKHFSLEDLRSLCFALGEDPDILPGQGQGKAVMARELVSSYKRRKDLDRLLHQAQRERPKVDWSSVFTSPTAQQRLHQILGSSNFLYTMVALLCIGLILTIAWMNYAALVAMIVPHLEPDLPPFESDPAALVVVADGLLTGCVDQEALRRSLRSAVQHQADADAQPRFRFIDLTIRSTPDPNVVQEQGARVGVWGTCHDQQGATVEVTTVFTAPSADPIALLHEPRELTVQGTLSYDQAVVRASMFYEAGYYEEARQSLELYASRGATDTDFNWLWGNILLRLDEWDDAVEAYNRALGGNKAGQDPLVRAQLQGNQWLARLFWHRATQGTAASACSTGTREELEDAAKKLEPGVGNAAVRAKLHLLLGTVILRCPRQNENIWDGPIDQVNKASKLALPGDNKLQALISSLRTQIMERNQAHPDSGSAGDIQAAACKALQLNPALPDPYHTLGLIYADHGLKDEARQAFFRYRELAPLRWQRRDARQLELLTWRWPAQKTSADLQATGICLS